MRTISGGRIFCPILVGVSLFANTTLAQDWWVGAGPVFRPGLRVSVGGSSYVQTLGLHDPLAAGPLTAPGGIGSPNAYADRTYDDGYVKRDPGTGHPTTIDPNTTWNWGFENPAQYNGSAQTLTFHKTGEAGYSVLANGSAQASDEMLGAGLQLLGGFALKQSGKWTVDLCLGFQAVWGGQEMDSRSTYREVVRQVGVTDVYDTSGIPTAQFPAGGFQGTYLGPFGTPPVIPSPVIPNLPTWRSSLAGAALSSSYNSVGFDVDQSLFQVAVGPRLSWAASRRVSLNLRPTVSMNIIDLEAQRTELLVQQQAGFGSQVLRRWTEQGAQTEVFLGLGVSGGVDVELGKGFYAGVFGGYEWVVDEAEVAVGPGTVSLDASGWVAGALFGKRF